MSLVVASTTDTEEQIRDGLKAFGFDGEGAQLEEISTERQQATPDGEKPEGEGKKDPEPGTAEHQEQVTETGKTAPASEPEKTTQEQQGKKDESALQKRFDKIHREKMEEREARQAAEARATALEKKIEDLEKAKPEGKAAELQTKPERPKRPKQAEFESVEELETALDAYDTKLADYEDKLASWKAGEEVQKFRTEQQTRQLQTEAAERQQAWDQHVEATAQSGRYTDFEETAASLAADGDVKVAPAFVDAMVETNYEFTMPDGTKASITGADVAYYIAKHPDEAERIFSATFYKPGASAREVTKCNRAAGTELAWIVAEVREELASKVKPKPEAPAVTEKPKPAASPKPAPIKPVGTRTAGGAKDPGEMSPAEYATWRKAGGGK